MARAWFGTIAVIVAASLLIQLMLIFATDQNAHYGSGGVGQQPVVKLVRFLSYFTIQSNFFVLFTSIALALNLHREGPIWRFVRLDAMLGIVISGLVYSTVLASQVNLTGWGLAATIGFHYIAPWATLLGWLVFGPRSRMSWSTLGFAFIWPVLWLIYTFVHGAITSWYPYPFLDVIQLGYLAVFRNTALALVIAIVFAAILILIDKRLPALVKKECSL